MAACLSMAAAPASAQTSTLRTEAGGSRQVQLGIEAGGLMVLGVDVGEVRVSAIFPCSERLSLEGFVSSDVSGRIPREQTCGLQVTHRIRGGQAFELFASYGGFGLLGRDATFPVFGLVGVGMQKTPNRHLAVRLESQIAMLVVLPVTLRGAVGVTIPIGRGY